MASKPPRSRSRLGSASIPGSSENSTSFSLDVAHVRLASLAVPQTMLSPSLIVPHTMLSPDVPSVIAEPQRTFEAHALADGLMTPPVRRWLPQTMERLNVGRSGYLSPGFAFL